MDHCGIFFRYAGGKIAPLLVLVLALDLVGAGRLASQQELPDRVVVTNSYVNVRSGPGTSYRRIGRAVKDESWKVTAQKPKWYRIDFRGKPGWVYASLVRPEYVSPLELERLNSQLGQLDLRLDKTVDRIETVSRELTGRIAAPDTSRVSKKKEVALPRSGEQVRKPGVAEAAVPAGEKRIAEVWALIPGGARWARGQKIKGLSLLAAAVGCAAGSVYFNGEYRKMMDRYHELPSSADPERFDSYHRKAQRNLNVSNGLLYAAAGIYALNIIDHFIILPRSGLSLELGRSGSPEKGGIVHLSLSRSF